jgi:hypothetical protein
MDLLKIIQDLRQERDKLDAIIASIEELQGYRPDRVPVQASRRGRRSMDAQGRLEVSRRMKKYWESRRNSRTLEASGDDTGHSVINTLSA